MKIGLGTVQFGLDYGISNAAGRVPQDEVQRILALAAARGVEVLDTAAAYGDAEAVLGEALPATHRFRIVTKLPRAPADLDSAAVPGWVRAQIEGSLERLRVDAVEALLMHNADDLLDARGGAFVEALERLRADGRVRRVGASVYTGGQIDALLQRMRPDLVQLPINLLDRRLFDGGQLHRLKAQGVEIHARSLLLQGVLVMDPDRLPAHLAAAAPVLRAFRAAAAARGLSPLAAAVAYVNAVPQIDCAVFGVTTAAELTQILDAAALCLPANWYAPFALRDEHILNPARWPAR